MLVEDVSAIEILACPLHDFKFSRQPSSPRFFLEVGVDTSTPNVLREISQYIRGWAIIKWRMGIYCITGNVRVQEIFANIAKFSCT